MNFITGAERATGMFVTAKGTESEEYCFRANSVITYITPCLIPQFLAVVPYARHFGPDRPASTLRP